MSRRVEKLIEQEDQEILRMLHNEEALYVHVYYTVNIDGRRVYDRDAMREEFEDNMNTLISLNRQRECSQFWEPEKPTTSKDDKVMRWPEDFDSKH